MLTAGIDIGAKTIKLVVAEDGHVKARIITPAGFRFEESMEKAWTGLETHSGYRAADMVKILATGAGRKKAAHAHGDVTEVIAAARGAFALDAAVRTIIEVGAEEGRVAKIDKSGKVVDFAVNEKCAAGTGAFIEAMARVLEVPIEELGKLSLQSTRAVSMKAHCVVFAESELITLVHANTPKPDIARAIHDAITDRIVSMVRWVGMEQNVMLIGGVARNAGFVASLKRELQSDIVVPEEPEYAAAYGAALIAAVQ